MDSLCFAGPDFATEPRGALGKKLAEITGLAKVFFTLGGSEANENAMKMVRGMYSGRDKITHHALPIVPRRDDGRHDGFGRSASLAGRARHLRASCARVPIRTRLSLSPSGRKWRPATASAFSHIEEIIRMGGVGEHRGDHGREGITGSNGLLIPPGRLLSGSCGTCCATPLRHPADRRRGDERLRTHRQVASPRSTTASSRIL